MTEIFVCIALVSGYLHRNEVQVSEYGIAAIHFEKEGWAYDADVFEGRINSLTLMNKTHELETMSYMNAGTDLRGLTSKLDYKGQHFSAECWIEKRGYQNPEQKK